MTIPFLKQLDRDERGTAVVELALVAPILAALIMITVDVGSAYSRKLALEQGVQRAVEKVMQTTQLVTVQQTIKDEVALQADVPKDNVTVTFPLLCDDKVMPDLGLDAQGFSKAECDAGEVPRHYIQVEAWTEFDPIFDALALGTKNANGNYVVRAKAGMRTR